MFKQLIVLMIIPVFMSCAPHNAAKVVTTSEDRKAFTEKPGSLIPQRLKDPFIAGKATTGMSKNMIVFLLGSPDRTENNRYGISWSATVDSIKSANLRDTIWNYFASDSVSIRRGLVFRSDTLALILGDSLR